MIQQLNAVVAAQAAKLINRAQHACKGWRARALFGAQVGHGDIIAADGLMIVDHALHIRLNQLERHMAGYGAQAAFLQHGAGSRGPAGRFPRRRHGSPRLADKSSARKR